MDDILAMVGEGSPRADLVNSIALGSEALKTELAKFIHCSSSMRIVSFYETTQTRKLVQVRPSLTPAIASPKFHPGFGRSVVAKWR